MQPDLAQIATFEEHFAKAQASSVVELPWGYGHFQRDFPQCHSHNRVVVSSAASSESVLAAADELFTDAGLTYRNVTVVDDALGRNLTPEFNRAGFERETLVLMTSTNRTVDAPSHTVDAVSYHYMRDAVMLDWRVDLPNASADVHGQLADRMSLYSRGAEVTFLVTHEASEIAARVELYVDRAHGIAQIESLQTHHDYRGCGHARALVCEARRRAWEAGCAFSFLVADVDDWPHEWYARLGYMAAHRSHNFIRLGA